MPLRLLLDEHLRGMLWEAVKRYGRETGVEIDIVCVGDDSSLPLGSDDEVILPWAEEHERILITRDKKTIPDLLAAHLQSGRHSPGVFVIRRRSGALPIVEHIALVSEAGDAAAYADGIHWIP